MNKWLLESDEWQIERRVWGFFASLPALTLVYKINKYCQAHFVRASCDFQKVQDQAQYLFPTFWEEHSQGEDRIYLVANESSSLGSLPLDEKNEGELFQEDMRQQPFMKSRAKFNYFLWLESYEMEAQKWKKMESLLACGPYIKAPTLLEDRELKKFNELFEY